MKSKEIRQKFLQFFVSKGSALVPSASLIPHNDPTLMFTSAGMVPFKANFLGIDKSLKSAVSCQKCVRTTDIDSVGFTKRHLTFFEMLGNFSFGDYFKKEAIAYAWEFLTKELAIPAEKLYVSIYKGGIAERDADAYKEWLKYVAKERIFELGEKDNFWTMGPTGPCGPCTEIYFDFGKNDCKNPACDITCDCGRYVEIWNVVFTQFDRKEDGSIVPLAQKNIDTGMGLERLAMAMQNAPSLFETDVFTALTAEAKKLIKVQGKDAAETSALRIVADHARSASFLIAEGILPSNEGRGYILRRLIRRAVRYGKLHGALAPFLHKLVEVVRANFGEVYPEIEKNASYISEVINTEESAFFKTLVNGERRLGEMMAGAKNISGADAFDLYETFGFPFELTKEIALLKNIDVDEEGYAAAKAAAQKKSRAYADEDSKELLKTYQKLENELKNKFVGYEKLEAQTEVLFVLDDKLVLKETPFYPLGGGQTGDRGTIEFNGQVMNVVDTTKALDKIILHKVDKVLVKPGDKVFAKVDALIRKKTAANHSSIHLINEALRRVLGKGVHQAGSYVSDEVFRFDYTTTKAPTADELKKVFEIANAAAQAEHTVACEVRPLSDADKLGAVTLVGEQYADPARFVLIGADFNDATGKYSLELCGGTHVKNTAEIMSIVLLKESALAAGVRRIEGVAGLSAVEYLKKKNDILERTAKLLLTPSDDVFARVEKLLEETKAAKKEIADLRQKLLTGGEGAASKEYTLSGGAKFVAFYAEGASAKELRVLADNLSHKTPGAVILAAVDEGDKRSFVIKSAAPGVDAGALAKKMAEKFNGRAGGRADFAQGGAEAADWEDFVKYLTEI